MIVPPHQRTGVSLSFARMPSCPQRLPRKDAQPRRSPSPHCRGSPSASNSSRNKMSWTKLERGAKIITIRSLHPSQITCSCGLMLLERNSGVLRRLLTEQVEPHLLCLILLMVAPESPLKIINQHQKCFLKEARLIQNSPLNKKFKVPMIKERRLRVCRKRAQ